MRGTVRVGNTELLIQSWSNSVITARVPMRSASGQLTGTGQLVVTRGDNGRSSQVGLTLHVGGTAPRYVPAGGSIQAAVDAAPPGALLMVPPGTYSELVVMWKPLRLQGFGASSVIINAVKFPNSKLTAWQALVERLVGNGSVAILPGQNAAPGADLGGNQLDPPLLPTEQGPAILVMGRETNRPGSFSRINSRIDGFTLTGSDDAGGLLLNGYNENLIVSNNNIIGNSGVYGGGVRVGHPFLVEETGGGPQFVDSANNGIRIMYNQISGNGGLGGFGGGISIYTGAAGYRIEQNFVCGNFQGGHGAGIAHYGRSDNGLIADNIVSFNETFQQTSSANGGGILISGADPVDIGSTLSPGSGDVDIRDNWIRGNLAGTGDGGGIELYRVNGLDIARRPNSVEQWWRVRVMNNIIANNIAAYAGGGIAMQDALRVHLVHNTLVNNDSTGTAARPSPSARMCRAPSPRASPRTRTRRTSTVCCGAASCGATAATRDRRS